MAVRDVGQASSLTVQAASCCQFQFKGALENTGQGCPVNRQAGSLTYTPGHGKITSVVRTVATQRTGAAMLPVTRTTRASLTLSAIN